MITIDIPGHKTIHLKNLVMDFNGTLAVDGHLIEGVARRLRLLADQMDLLILTADTFGLVEKSCKGLPLKIQKIKKGDESRQKKDIVDSLGPDITAAIGNGANDSQMLKAACLGFVVLGKEGTCSKAIAEADIIVPDICLCLDLFVCPKRIVATLRN